MRERKAAEKARLDAEIARDEARAETNPFGRPGAGAPLRDIHGNVRANPKARCNAVMPSPAATASARIGAGGEAAPVAAGGRRLRVSEGGMEPAEREAAMRRQREAAEMQQALAEQACAVVSVHPPPQTSRGRVRRILLPQVRERTEARAAEKRRMDADDAREEARILRERQQLEDAAAHERRERAMAAEETKEAERHGLVTTRGAGEVGDSAGTGATTHSCLTQEDRLRQQAEEYHRRVAEKEAREQASAAARGRNATAAPPQSDSGSEVRGGQSPEAPLPPPPPNAAPGGRRSRGRARGEGSSEPPPPPPPPAVSVPLLGGARGGGSDSADDDEGRLADLLERERDSLKKQMAREIETQREAQKEWMQAMVEQQQMQQRAMLQHAQQLHAAVAAVATTAQPAAAASAVPTLVSLAEMPALPDAPQLPSRQQMAPSAPAPPPQPPPLPPPPPPSQQHYQQQQWGETVACAPPPGAQPRCPGGLHWQQQHPQQPPQQPSTQMAPCQHQPPQHSSQHSGSHGTAPLPPPPPSHPHPWAGGEAMADLQQSSPEPPASPRGRRAPPRTLSSGDREEMLRTPYIDPSARPIRTPAELPPAVPPTLSSPGALCGPAAAAAVERLLLPGLSPALPSKLAAARGWSPLLPDRQGAAPHVPADATEHIETAVDSSLRHSLRTDSQLVYPAEEALRRSLEEVPSLAAGERPYTCTYARGPDAPPPSQPDWTRGVRRHLSALQPVFEGSAAAAAAADSSTLGPPPHMHGTSRSRPASAGRRAVSDPDESRPGSSPAVTARRGSAPPSAGAAGGGRSRAETPGLDSLMRRAEERLRMLTLQEVTPEMGDGAGTGGVQPAAVAAADARLSPASERAAAASATTSAGAARRAALWASLSAESTCVPLSASALVLPLGHAGEDDSPPPASASSAAWRRGSISLLGGSGTDDDDDDDDDDDVSGGAGAHSSRPQSVGSVTAMAARAEQQLRQLAALEDQLAAGDV